MRSAVWVNEAVAYSEGLQRPGANAGIFLKFAPISWAGVILNMAPPLNMDPGSIFNRGIWTRGSIFPCEIWTPPPRENGPPPFLP